MSLLNSKFRVIGGEANFIFIDPEYEWIYNRVMGFEISYAKQNPPSGLNISIIFIMICISTFGRVSEVFILSIIGCADLIALTLHMEGIDIWGDGCNDLIKSNHLKWCTRKPLRKKRSIKTPTIQLISHAIFSAQLIYLYSQTSQSYRLYQKPSQIINILSFMISILDFLTRTEHTSDPFPTLNSNNEPAVKSRKSSILSLLLISLAFIIFPIDLYTIGNENEGFIVNIDIVSNCILACSYAASTFLISAKSVRLRYWIIILITVSILKMTLDLILLIIEKSWDYKAYILVQIFLVSAIVIYILELVHSENEVFLKSEKILKDIIFNIPSGMVLFDQNHKPLFTNSKLYSILGMEINSEIDLVVPVLSSLSFDSYIKKHREGLKSWPSLEQNKNKGEEFCYEKNLKIEEILQEFDCTMQRKYYTKISTGSDPDELENILKYQNRRLSRRVDMDTSMDQEIHRVRGYLYERHYKVEVSFFTEEAPFILLTFVDITAAKSITESIMEKTFKSNLLNSFSHELKTPLNHSLGQLGLAIGDSSLSNEIKMKYLFNPFKSLRLLELMIQDITDFLKIETHRIDIVSKPFTLSGFLRDAKSLTADKAKEKGIELTFQEIDDPGSVFVVGDRERIIRMLINFILNSVKYTFNGLVKVKCSIKRGMDPLGEGNQDFLTIEIADTRFSKTDEDLFDYYLEENSATNLDEIGCPLPNENKEFNLIINKIMMQHILPDEQSFNCSVSKYGVTYKMVLPCMWRETDVWEDHDNTEQSWMEELEKGCTIGVYEKSLGIVEGPLAVPPNSMVINKTIFDKYSIDCAQKKDEPLTLKKESCLQSQLCGPIRRKRKLGSLISTQKMDPDAIENEHVFLIVDDDAFNLTSLDMILNSEGIKSVKALNGEAAIEEVCKINNSEGRKITLALMDLNMPVMDGYECAEKLTKMMKQGEILPFPIIACSANDSFEDRLKAISSGMQDFISKPVSPTKLRSALTNISLIEHNEE